MPRSSRGRAPPGKRKSRPGRGGSLKNTGNGNGQTVKQTGVGAQGEYRLAVQRKAANRAFRRRDEAKRRGQEVIWRRLIKQSGGACTLTVWRVGGPTPDDAASVAIIKWIAAVTAGELDPLCLCCDRRPTPPAAFSILAPWVATPEAMT